MFHYQIEIFLLAIASNNVDAACGAIKFGHSHLWK